MPASVMNAVPLGSTVASDVWTWVCVPTTAVTRPSSQRPNAAFSLVAFQLTLTHWFYLYLPWVVPFVFLWLLLPQTTTRSASIEDALPVDESQAMTAPSIRKPP